MKIKYDMKVSKSLIRKYGNEAKKAVKDSVRVVAQDLARTASESTPHLTGDLEDSYTIEYSGTGAKTTATVEFAVFKDGFNYAIAMHEWRYKLGEQSQAKSGGTGMSGTNYTVGRKFLTRVLQGEAETYKDYIEKKVKNAWRRG